MKVIVFGATGLVGKELVKQALYNNYEVKAFGRNVFIDNLPEDKKVELVHGALFDEGEVYHALRDCDAVLSAIGGAADNTDKTRSLGIKNILKQMNKAGIKRIVALGGMGVLDNSEGIPMMEQEDFPPQYAAVSIEHKKALDFLMNSNTQWTFVCAPDIQPGEPTGIFKTMVNQLPESDHLTVTSGDVALFMLKEMVQKEFVSQRVGISS